MQVVEYLHTALLVTDLARAEQFYSVVLGLSKVDRVLKFPGIWYQIGPIQIHLIQADRVINELVDHKWGRNPHLALSVTNLEAAKERLLAHHCPIQVSASGRAALFTKDPDGNLIELSEVSSVEPSSQSQS